MDALERPVPLAEVETELADTLIYLTRLGCKLDIDSIHRNNSDYQYTILQYLWEIWLYSINKFFLYHFLLGFYNKKSNYLRDQSWLLHPAL